MAGAPKLRRGISYQAEICRTGFATTDECHPVNVVPGGVSTLVATALVFTNNRRC